MLLNVFLTKKKLCNKEVSVTELKNSDELK